MEEPHGFPSNPTRSARQNNNFILQAPEQILVDLDVRHIFDIICVS